LSPAVLEKGRVKLESHLDGCCFSDGGFLKGSALAAVVRGDHAIVPCGSTRLEAGDVIMVLATRKNAASVRKWLREHC